MYDYELTAGQQQQLSDFLDAGNSIYIEGNDFAYTHSMTDFYKMFGGEFTGMGNYQNNVEYLEGQIDSLVYECDVDYMYGASYPDQWVDSIESTGGDILFRCQNGDGRVVAYAGDAGTYRAIHSTIWLGAIKDTGATHSEAEIMQAYLNYLRGNNFVVGLTPELSVTTGGTVHMFLENTVLDANRKYAVVASVTGTQPGWPVGSVVIPVNFDIFTQLVIGFWNIPPFVNFQSSLDAAGRAQATLDYSGTLDPTAVGVIMHYAFVLAAPFDKTSNAVGIPIVP